MDLADPYEGPLDIAPWGQRVAGRVSDDQVWCINPVPASALSSQNLGSSESLACGEAGSSDELAAPQKFILATPAGGPGSFGPTPQDIGGSLLSELGTAILFSQFSISRQSRLSILAPSRGEQR